MKKYTINFSRNIDDTIIKNIYDLNLRILYIDDYIKDFVIVETDKELTYLSQLSDVVDIQVSPVYSLQDAKQLNKESFLALPMPSVDRNILRNMGLYGLGSKVAVIDSGHLATNGKVEAYKNFTKSQIDEAEQVHGAIVISLIKNFAPAAKIFSAKVAIKGDDIEQESVFRALAWIRSLVDVKIINISLGVEQECSGICNLSRVIDKMSDEGYIIIAAVGNTGSQVHCPACSNGAISVGSLNKEGNGIAIFSCSGHINSNKPDVIAPGYGILNRANGKEGSYSGTSFSAPIITGIVAATRSMYNNVKSVKGYIIQSNDKLDNVSVSKQGAGILNLQKLLEVIKNEEKNHSKR